MGPIFAAKSSAMWTKQWFLGVYAKRSPRQVSDIEILDWIPHVDWIQLRRQDILEEEKTSIKFVEREIGREEESQPYTFEKEKDEVRSADAVEKKKLEKKQKWQGAIWKERSRSRRG